MSIRANFKTYATYVTDSLHQWETNRVLTVTGLNLTKVPEVRFWNADTGGAIVRQATMKNHVITVGIPNSLLQDPLRIIADIGTYEGKEFKIVERVEIPVIAGKRPEGYQIEDTDEEVYSFARLENMMANMATQAQVANIVANANSTDGNSELVDIRVDVNGVTRPSAGAAVREQVGLTRADQRAFDLDGSTTFTSFAAWKVGGMASGEWVYQINRIMSMNILHFDRDIALKIADGFRVGVHTVTEAGAFIADSGWQQNAYTIPAGTYFKLVIARVTEINEHPSLLEFSGAVTFNTRTETKLVELQEKIEEFAGRKRKAWLTSAHRGFVDSTLTENCLAAYYNAHLNGADMIETDARLTSDGVLVVNHDPTVTGTTEDGTQMTYTVASTPSSTLCSLRLANSAKWGVQYVPTLAQVLHLAYHTGMQVNIDLKDGITSAEAVAKMVVAHGMQGRAVYALNGSGMTGINTIMAIDPDARFIDSAANFSTQVADFAERGKRCYSYTSDFNTASVQAIRDSGCMLALISLTAANFTAAIAHHPDMCEYLHTSDFRQIEDSYFETLELY